MSSEVQVMTNFSLVLSFLETSEDGEGPGNMEVDIGL